MQHTRQQRNLNCEGGKRKQGRATFQRDQDFGRVRSVHAHAALASVFAKARRVSGPRMHTHRGKERPLLDVLANLLRRAHEQTWTHAVCLSKSRQWRHALRKPGGHPCHDPTARVRDRVPPRRGGTIALTCSDRVSMHKQHPLSTATYRLP